MIPTDFTIFTKEKGGIVKGKFAWDKKTEEKAEVWAKGPNEWDPKTNSYKVPPPPVKHRYNNMVPFNEIKIVGHGFDKKRSWLEVETPDGVRFEVDTGDLLELVKEIGTQTEGILKGDFIWVVNGKSPSVVCKTTKRYQDILTDSQKKKMNDSFPMRKLEVGGAYLTSTTDTHIKIYCGKFLFIVQTHGMVNGTWTKQHVIKLQHVFLGLYDIHNSGLSTDAAIDQKLATVNPVTDLDFCTTKLLRVHLTTRPIDAKSVVLKFKEHQVAAALQRDVDAKKRSTSGWGGAYQEGDCLYLGGISPSLTAGMPLKIPQVLEKHFKAYCVKHNWTPDPTAIEFTPNVEL